MRKIHLNALRLEQLIQNLLHLSRLEVNLPTVDIKPVRLFENVQTAINLQRDAMDKMQVTVSQDIPTDILIRMELRDLELILNNLISNAVKYNKIGGSITIRYLTYPKPVLCIEDTGLGIPEELLPRIFERFFRTDSARAEQEGTGLGLAIVKHAALKYGMTLRAESTLNVGSRFYIDIPNTILEQG